MPSLKKWIEMRPLQHHTSFILVLTDRVRLINFILTACCLFVAPVSDVPAEEQGIDRPNIVFLLADDLGWNQVSWNNPLIHTPNLQVGNYSKFHVSR